MKKNCSEKLERLLA